MRDSKRLRFLCYALILLAQNCSPGKENHSAESQNQVKEAVKEIVTQDFKLYDGAKQSLQESAEKSKARLEMIDKEEKDESK